MPHRSPWALLTATFILCRPDTNAGVDPDTRAGVNRHYWETHAATKKKKRREVIPPLENDQ